MSTKLLRKLTAAFLFVFMIASLNGCASNTADVAKKKVTKVQSKGLRLSDEEKSAFVEDVCAPSKCENAVATLQRWDNATIQCVVSSIQPCYPYACGPINKIPDVKSEDKNATIDSKVRYCAAECTGNQMCAAGAVCNSKKQCVPVDMKSSDIEPYRAPVIKKEEPAAAPMPAPEVSPTPEPTPVPSATPAAEEPKPGTSPTSPPAPGGIFGDTNSRAKQRISLSNPATSPLNLLQKVESWGIGPATQIAEVSIKLPSASGAQLLALLKKLPDGMTFELSLQKEET